MTNQPAAANGAVLFCNNTWFGHLAVLVANLLWGLMAPVSKEALNYFALNGISPVVLPSMRMIGATCCFWLFSLFTPRERIDRADWPWLILAGLLSIAFNQNLFVCGIAFTSPIDASVMTTMLPIVTMLLAAAVLREPITGMKAGGVVVGLCGALLLVFSGGGELTLDANHALGDAMCLGAQVSFACYLVFCKRIIGKYSPITLMKWMFLTSSVVVLPFTSGQLMEVDYAHMPLSVWMEIGYVVLLGTFVTFLLMPIAQKRLRPTVVSSYNYVQPVVSAVASVSLGLAAFGLVKGLAAVLVFAGVLLVTHSKSRAQLDLEQKKEPNN